MKHLNKFKTINEDVETESQTFHLVTLKTEDGEEYKFLYRNEPNEDEVLEKFLSSTNGQVYVDEGMEDTVQYYVEEIEVED